MIQSEDSTGQRIKVDFMTVKWMSALALGLCVWQSVTELSIDMNESQNQFVKHDTVVVLTVKLLQAIPFAYFLSNQNPLLIATCLSSISWHYTPDHQPVCGAAITDPFALSSTILVATLASTSSPKARS